MIKPKRLVPGDKIAVVSLSWGGIGEKELIHKYYIAKERLEKEFGLEVVAMPHALKGSVFVAKHPELRAKDLMDAFLDKSISAIFCAIGGDDTVRLIPYIDYDVIRKNPKIFMGYSDSTANHFMMYKAGLVSFYGPTVMCEFGEYVKMFDYTKAAVKALLFKNSEGYRITPCPEWSKDFVPWSEENVNMEKKLIKDEYGYEVLQGKGKAKGHLLGGCLDALVMYIGTEIWPSIEEWRGAILFLETSEMAPTPDLVKFILRNLAAQGILKVLQGILIAKPMNETYYEEYKQAFLEVVASEEQLVDLPIIYNLSIGHAVPIGVLPYGIGTEIDCENKSITLLESATT